MPSGEESATCGSSKFIVRVGRLGALNMTVLRQSQKKARWLQWMMVSWSFNSTRCPCFSGAKKSQLQKGMCEKEKDCEDWHLPLCLPHNGKCEAGTTCAFHHVDRKRFSSPKKAANMKGQGIGKPFNSIVVEMSSYFTGEPGPASTVAGGDFGSGMKDQNSEKKARTDYFSKANTKKSEYQDKHSSRCVFPKGRRHEKESERS